jgi:hypothetical protein
MRWSAHVGVPRVYPGERGVYTWSLFWPIRQFQALGVRMTNVSVCLAVDFRSLGRIWACVFASVLGMSTAERPIRTSSPESWAGFQTSGMQHRRGLVELELCLLTSSVSYLSGMDPCVNSGTQVFFLCFSSEGVLTTLSPFGCDYTR